MHKKGNIWYGRLSLKTHLSKNSRKRLIIMEKMYFTLNQFLKLAVAGFLCLALSACFDDSDDDETAGDPTPDAPSTPSGPTDITDAILENRSGDCTDYVGTYESTVLDVNNNNTQFDGELTISQSGDKCIISSNDIPNHNFHDGNSNFATDVAEIDKYFEIPTDPEFAATKTDLEMGVVNVVLLNGVVVDILPAACYGVGSEPLGQEKIGCGTDQIDNPWRYDPMSALNDFGTDSHNAHVQPDGTYHYHGNPNALFNDDCASQGTPSPVIGFAADGFPVYGRCIDDGNGGVRAATSSYALKTGARQPVAPYTTPTVTGNVLSANYNGQFRGDYEYTAASGDLDECNGMTVNGQYGYYVTNSFPWIVNCYKGTVQDSFRPSNQQQMSIKLHGHGPSHKHGSGHSHSH